MEIKSLMIWSLQYHNLPLAISNTHFVRGKEVWLQVKPCRYTHPAARCSCMHSRIAINASQSKIMTDLNNYEGVCVCVWLFGWLCGSPWLLIMKFVDDNTVLWCQNVQHSWKAYFSIEHKSFYVIYIRLSDSLLKTGMLSLSITQ